MIYDEDFRNTMMANQKRRNHAVHLNYDITKLMPTNVMRGIGNSHLKRTAKHLANLREDSPKVFDEIKDVGV